MDSFYNLQELSNIGFRSYGENVKISRKCSIYTPELISIGDNVRIDDFCILSGNIKFGNNIHISAYCALYGSQGIVFHDYSGCSARSTIYSAMDDFSGDYMIGPIYPDSMTNVQGGKVIVRQFVQIGAHCLVFPNLEIGEGAVIGAMSMVKNDIQPWTINIGVPSRVLKKRSDRCKKLL